MAFKKTKNETTILLEKISKQIGGLAEQKPKYERLGLFFANWSQVAMLLVVIYGYIYTVLPVVQKEQISEQLAELELEKKSWDKQLNEATHKIDQKNIELKKLIDSKKQLLLDIEELSQEKEKSRSNLDKIKSEYNQTHTELVKTKASVNVATSDLLELHKETLLGKTRLPDNLILILNNTGSSYDIFHFENEASIKGKLEKTYLSPLKHANENLARLYESYKSAKGINQAAKYKLYSQYKNGIKKHKMNLICPTPNFEAWEAAFIETKSIKSLLVKSCINNAFSKRINDEKWSKNQVAELKGSEFWPKQEKVYKNMCDFEIQYKIEELFRNEWEKIYAPCEERLLKTNNIILDDFDPSKIKPFTDISPPSNQFIVHSITNKK
ncbi:hypothetical protein ACET64_02745 [Aeromonas veronii]